MLLVAGSNTTVRMSDITVHYDRFGADIANHGMLSKYAEMAPFDSDANQLLLCNH